MTPLWLTAARSKIGTLEVPGPGVNAWIRSAWLGLRGGRWFWNTYGQDDSKLPWCGAFCAWAMQQANIDYPAKYASALAWAAWGQAATGPELGAVAVITRTGGGHVGFVDAVTPDQKWVRLVGGNQNDAVTAAWFDTTRIVAYRKPADASLEPAQILALGARSTTEA